MKRNKPKYALNKEYRKWLGIKAAIKAGTYGSVLTPSAVIFGLNYNEWFNSASQSNAPSIGLGFGMLIVSTLVTVVAVFKKDSDFMKKFSPLFYIAVICLLWAATFSFLSSILYEMGSMFYYISAGVLGGAVFDEVNTAYVNPRYEAIKAARDKAGVSSIGDFTLDLEKKEREDRAKHDAY
jgi:hypothetical protein